MKETTPDKDRCIKREEDKRRIREGIQFTLVRYDNLQQNMINLVQKQMRGTYAEPVRHILLY